MEGSPQKGYDEYIKNKNQVRKLMRTNDFKRHYGGKGSKDLDECFGLLTRHLDKLMESDRVQIARDDPSKVRRNLNSLMGVFVKDPLPKFVIDFTWGFTRLAYNWNKQLAKSQQIDNLARSLFRLLRNERTLQDSEDVLRQLIERGRRQLQSTPPSWELSRHYLKSLERE